MTLKNQDTLGEQALALIRAFDNKGLSELLSRNPVDVRDVYNTDGGRRERLDEYAKRIRNDKAVLILHDAGAPVSPSNGRRIKLTKPQAPKF